VLTVYRDWKFLIGHTRVSATERHVGLPERKSCSFLSEKLVISFITRGDITWQESSQCVTESSPSAQTCRLSVVRDAQRSAASRSRHNSTRQSRAIYAHNIYNLPFGFGAHAFVPQPASTTRVIPTLYGVLPTVLQPRIFRFAATNHAATRRPDRVRYRILVETLRVSPFPVLNLPRRTSCATLTHGVSRFRFSPPIFINTIAVAIEQRSPRTLLRPIYLL
jgi:hypothetical protein